MIYELQKFYYDTAQAFNPYTMPSFKKFVPVSQILFGTDYPLGGGSAAIVSKGLIADGGFTANELKAIDRENALETSAEITRLILLTALITKDETTTTRRARISFLS